MSPLSTFGLDDDGPWATSGPQAIKGALDANKSLQAHFRKSRNIRGLQLRGLGSETSAACYLLRGFTALIYRQRERGAMLQSAGGVPCSQSLFISGTWGKQVICCLSAPTVRPSSMDTGAQRWFNKTNTLIYRSKICFDRLQLGLIEFYNFWCEPTESENPDESVI